MRVVFDVLAELGRAGVFQPRPEFGEYMIKRKLVARARILMTNGNVRRFTRCHRQRYSHQPRFERIETGGFGVHRG